VVSATSTPLQKVSAGISNATVRVSYGIKVARKVLQSPQAQAVSTVAAPTVLALTLVNVASTMSLFNLLAYLQFFFTQPILLLGRRRRRKWGVVYNSLTKQPIDLAIVRLIHHKTHLVVQTKVTDKQGRFLFSMKKGSYMIEIVKPGYTFPSTYLAGRKEDVNFLDLYHGDVLNLKKSATIAVNVPLDPTSVEETPRRVLIKKFTKRLRHAVAFSGVLIGMVVLVITPTLATAVLMLAQVGIYLLFRRLALPAKSKSWGLTFDAKTRKPLGGVIVRIFDKKFNKLLESQVTDQNGKYGFIVRRNTYYLVASKSGYIKYVSPDIDLSTKDEAVVDQNIPMKPTI